MTTQDRLKELFDYNPETGDFINRFNRNPKSLKGMAAGGVNSKLGSRQISVDSRLYYAHRLVWLYVYGRWPEKDIDHINGIPDDNRLCNLREATHRQNLRNMKRPSHNTSGYKGVTWHRGDKRWRAQIKTGGVTKFLGNFVSKEDAAAAYDGAAEKMFGAFARTNNVVG